MSVGTTNHPEQTADPGRAPLEANSDLSDRSCCDATEQPRPPASDINDSDHRSLTYESELDLEDTSYLFWQDNTFDGELRFERDPGSPILDDATFVCPAALSKLLSGQAQALVKWGEGDRVFLCIFLLLEA